MRHDPLLYSYRRRATAAPAFGGLTAAPRGSPGRGSRESWRVCRHGAPLQALARDERAHRRAVYRRPA